MKKYIIFIILAFFILFLAGAASSARELDCTSDNCTQLIGYWKLNSNASDSSGNGNDCTISGPSNITGKIGNAFQFDGIDDFINTTILQELGTSGTISLWIKDGINNHSSLFSYGTSDLTDNNIHLIKTHYNTIEAMITNDTDGEIQPANVGFSASNINDSSWHHVAVSWNTTNTTLYFDGVLVSTTSGITNTISASSKLVIGSGEIGWADSFRIDPIAYYQAKVGTPTISESALLLNSANEALYYYPYSNIKDKDFELYFRFKEPTKDPSEGMEIAFVEEGASQVRFDRYEAGNQYRMHTALSTSEAVSMTANTWYRGRVTKKGNNHAFYVDDNQIGTTQNRGADYNIIPIVLINNANPGTTMFDDIRMIITDSGTNKVNSNYHNGSIDEVMLWNRTLNSSDILKLYNLGASPVSEDSQFMTVYGTTDFDDVANMSSIPVMKIAIPTSSVTWNSTVDAANQDYDTHINMDSDFVSINVSALDASINSSANISLTVEACSVYTIYYSPGFYDNFQDIKDNGQICNQSTTPACTDIQCNGNILSFTVEHFDSYGGEGSVAVPEFSTWAMIIGLLGAFMGLSFIRKQD